MTERAQTCSDEAPAQPASQADCTPEQLAETRYLRALDNLVADAAEGKQMQVLADTLAWTIARIAVGCGIAATGDMLRRVGSYIGSLETRRQAEREAQQAVRQGRPPH